MAASSKGVCSHWFNHTVQQLVRIRRKTYWVILRRNAYNNCEKLKTLSIFALLVYGTYTNKIWKEPSLLPLNWKSWI